MLKESEAQIGRQRTPRFLAESSQATHRAIPLNRVPLMASCWVMYLYSWHGAIGLATLLWFVIGVRRATGRI
jgi:hypothetical protein